MENKTPDLIEIEDVIESKEVIVLLLGNKTLNYLIKKPISIPHFVSRFIEPYKDEYPILYSGSPDLINYDSLTPDLKARILELVK